MNAKIYLVIVFVNKNYYIDSAYSSKEKANCKSTKILEEYENIGALVSVRIEKVNYIAEED